MIGTPCIGVCSTAVGDEVCRGCKRYRHEVRDWNTYTDDEKRIVLSRLDYFLRPIVYRRFQVFNILKIIKRLNYRSIRYDLQRSSAHLVYQLLKAASSEFEYSPYLRRGFSIKEDFRDYTLTQLVDQIDVEFLEASGVHYDRYFKGYYP